LNGIRIFRSSRAWSARASAPTASWESALASLRDLQHSFAAALRDPSATCAVRPGANLAIYRNNAELQFRNALAISFPVLRRRVGDDYFRQLAFHYRQAFPSRSGDLHWVGREFAAFLAEHLRGGEYVWLADLARLEWARETASVADPLPVIAVDALARFTPEELEYLQFRLQPSLQLQVSEYPVLSIWRANQVENAPPVDQSMGREHWMIRAGIDSPEIRRLEPAIFLYLCALSDGASLGEAMAVAEFDEPGLLQAMQFIFTETLVCEIVRRAPG
jgi:hypothetical protein